MRPPKPKLTLSERGKRARSLDTDETRRKRSEKAKAQGARESESRSERMKRYWASLTPEQRRARTETAITAMRKTLNDPDVISRRVESIKAVYANKSVEDRRRQVENAIHARGKNHMTDIEAMVAVSLDEMEIDYVFQWSFRQFAVDFYLPGFNMAIEVDGEFWHQDREIDRRKDAELIESGIQVCRISGADAKKRPIAAITNAVLIHGHKRGI